MHHFEGQPEKGLTKKKRSHQDIILYLGLIEASSISIKVARVEVIERYGKYGWPMDTYHPQNMATAHKDLGPLPSREMGSWGQKIPP